MLLYQPLPCTGGLRGLEPAPAGGVLVSAGQRPGRRRAAAAARRPGGSAGGDVRAHPVDDLGGRRARGEHLGHAHLGRAPATSSSGMMPPPNTTMSAASRAASSSVTLANRVMWAPERTDRPDGVGVLLDGRLDDLLGRLVQAGVDDLHAGVAQGPGDDLGAAVVAVQPGLGHDDAQGALAGLLAHEPQTTASPDRRGRRAPPGPVPGPGPGPSARDDAPSRAR